MNQTGSRPYGSSTSGKILPTLLTALLLTIFLITFAGTVLVPRQNLEQRQAHLVRRDLFAQPEAGPWTIQENPGQARRLVGLCASPLSPADRPPTTDYLNFPITVRFP